MIFYNVIEELPTLTFEQRQLLIRKAIELDDPPLSEEDKALIDARLAVHRADPDSSLPLDEMKARLRTR
jgi:putative addiction module component (TIGR02574 family)